MLVLLPHRWTFEPPPGTIVGPSVFQWLNFLTPRLGSIPDIPTYAWMALLKAGMLPGLTFAEDQDGRSFQGEELGKGKDFKRCSMLCQICQT